MSMVLSQHPGSHLLTAFQRLMLVALAILFFAACTEGYPTQDELIFNPLELNQTQRLQAMNQCGQDAHPDMTGCQTRAAAVPINNTDPQ